jgi:mRNA interferase MazF
MTNYQPGDLVLIAFPYTGGGTKVRPAMVVADTGDADIVVARITTQPPAFSFDVPLTAWNAAGLAAPSTVRVHKLATLEKSLVHRLLGRLDPAARPQVASMLRNVFAGW